MLMAKDAMMKADANRPHDPLSEHIYKSLAGAGRYTDKSNSSIHVNMLTAP